MTRDRSWGVSTDKQGVGQSPRGSLDGSPAVSLPLDTSTETLTCRDRNTPSGRTVASE